MYFCCLKPPSLGSLLGQPQETPQCCVFTSWSSVWALDLWSEDQSSIPGSAISKLDAIWYSLSFANNNDGNSHIEITKKVLPHKMIVRI